MGGRDALGSRTKAAGHSESRSVFEALCAAVQRRHAHALYHSALEISVPAGRFTIEMAPIPDTHGQSRGVVAEGPVGTKWAGRFRVFRYGSAAGETASSRTPNTQRRRALTTRRRHGVSGVENGHTLTRRLPRRSERESGPWATSTSP